MHRSVDVYLESSPVPSPLSTFRLATLDFNDRAASRGVARICIRDYTRLLSLAVVDADRIALQILNKVFGTLLVTTRTRVGSACVLPIDASRRCKRPTEGAQACGCRAVASIEAAIRPLTPRIANNMGGMRDDEGLVRL